MSFGLIAGVVAGSAILGLVLVVRLWRAAARERDVAQQRTRMFDRQLTVEKAAHEKERASRAEWEKLYRELHDNLHEVAEAERKRRAAITARPTDVNETAGALRAAMDKIDEA